MAVKKGRGMNYTENVRLSETPGTAVQRLMNAPRRQVLPNTEK